MSAVGRLLPFIVQLINKKDKEVAKIAAQKVLDVRKEYPDSTLADLYDPLTMPANLRRAHSDLDKLVDKA